ncbi:MAG: hypothetical protein H7A43_10810 [Verrucomicrobia bacterium]|nr:hypothetical protein [Kiritimatiellia bacterium]MCB1100943.1 hypothetical protein [Kiritimatiellia bacterium]MCP5489122.1 hypothetical protein [Verrucomicrobiota bacterium]
MTQPSREAIQTLVTQCLQEILNQRGTELSAPLTADTPMFGTGGLLDSIGIVTMIVDVEQTIAAEFNATVSLADDRAMSQRNSPYRSISALTDYILGQLSEGA